MGTGGLRAYSLSHSDKVNAGAKPAGMHVSQPMTIGVCYAFGVLSVSLFPVSFVVKLPNFISISLSFQFQKEVDLNNTKSQNFYFQTYCTNEDNFVCLFDTLYLIFSRNHY